MAGQPFPTQRSISQVIRRHTPGSLLYIDEHGLIAHVKEIQGEVDANVDLARLHSQVLRFLERWEAKEGRLLGISREIEERDLVPIAPSSVVWEPFPHLYRCVDDACQVLHDASDDDWSGKCRRCGGPLRQLPYVYYHRCGSLNYVKIPSGVRCPQHGRTSLYLHDTRRFTTSTWRCRACTYEHRFEFPVCQREACRKQDPKHPLLQASFWNDQWVHYCQTTAYINLDQRLAERFLGSARGRSLLHSGVLGEVEAGCVRLLRALENEGERCPSCGALVPHGNRFCGQCGSRLPEDPSQGDGSLPGAERPITPESGRCAFALLRDDEASRSLRDSARTRAAHTSEDDPYRWGMARARQVGIFDVVLVSNFPLTTAAIGYTRERSEPPAWLRAFQARGERTPIFTQSVETEAWLVQLSALIITRWLSANGIEPYASDLQDVPADEASRKAWLIDRIVQDETNPTPATHRLRGLVFALLHSFAHVTLLSLAANSGLDATSLGEQILPDALAFALYASDSELGSLTAAFEQLTGVVFAGVAEDYVTCKLDPGCSTDDGGACVGCIQLYRGCQVFNDTLSRAYLYGGWTGNAAHGSLAQGYVAVAASDAGG